MSKQPLFLALIAAEKVMSSHEYKLGKNLSFIQCYISSNYGR